MSRVFPKSYQGYRGKLIVFEGVHGAGKTTQILRLKQHLNSLGYKVLLSKAHVGDIVNRAVYKLVTSSSSPGFTDQLVRLFLICGARASRVESEILPALKKGWIVISDRYLLATLVYQGRVGGLDYDFVKQAANLSCRGVRADLTLVLDLPVDQARQRRNKGKVEQDSLDRLPQSYHQKSREGFLEHAKKFDLTIINGNQPENIVEKVIWQAVKEILEDG